MAELLLVDGHALAFRAFYGFPSRYFSPSGEPVNAVQGFGSMLVNTIRAFDPEGISVVFDAPGKCFRNDIYPEYKANRPPVPPELKSQFPLMERFLKHIGIPSVSVDDVEGDDVLASIALASAGTGISVNILSPDKDLCQLLETENIALLKYDGRSGTYSSITGESFSSDFGFEPRCFRDYLALMGDRCDNVPGVAGIGKKTASDLVRDLGCLEDIYDNIGLLRSSVRKKLEAQRDMAFLSRDLVTLRTDVTLPERFFDRCCIDHDPLYDFCSTSGLQNLYHRCMG